jgi:hypothetical protein
VRRIEAGRNFVAGSLSFELPLHHLGRQGRRQNAAARQHAEEFPPARIATIGRKSQPALQVEQRPPIDSSPGNVAEVKISAPRTVRVKRERQRHGPPMESMFTSAASPGALSADGPEQARQPVSPRAKTVVAAASRTNHREIDSPSGLIGAGEYRNAWVVAICVKPKPSRARPRRATQWQECERKWAG